MTDWIDDSNEDFVFGQQERARQREAIFALSGRKWEALTRQIRHDADKLTATALPRIKERLRVDGRDTRPDALTMYVDNTAYPAIYLEIRLDRDSESINIHQLRREQDGGSEETDEKLTLELTNENDLLIKRPNAAALSIEEVSKYILSRFLDR